MEAHRYGVLVFYFDMDEKFWQKPKVCSFVHESHKHVKMNSGIFCIVRFIPVFYNFKWKDRKVNCLIEKKEREHGVRERRRDNGRAG